MNLDELKAFVNSSPHIKKVWLNADGVAYLHDPQKKGFEAVSRHDLLKETTEKEISKGKK